MSKRGGRRKTVTVDVTHNPLGKWGAILRFRGMAVQFAAKGPTVVASTPDELRVAILGALLSHPDGQGPSN